GGSARPAGEGSTAPPSARAIPPVVAPGPVCCGVGSGAPRGLDRLSRSMLDFAALMATAQKQSWALVALDCVVDTSTPAGEAMAHVLATFGQFERRLIGQRTKEALAAKKAGGVRLGRPPTVPQAVVRRMQRQRARGDSLRVIADGLNDDGVPTCQGGKQWYAATVRHVLIRTS